MQREVARLVAEEFWSQGDMERELGKEPAEMMKRELHHQLAVNQVGFIDGVCLPVYRALSALSPALRPMEEAAISNRERCNIPKKSKDVEILKAEGSSKYLSILIADGPSCRKRRLRVRTNQMKRKKTKKTL